jgi:hypothetical protein
VCSTGYTAYTFYRRTKFPQNIYKYIGQSRQSSEIRRIDRELARSALDSFFGRFLSSVLELHYRLYESYSMLLVPTRTICRVCTHATSCQPHCDFGPKMLPVRPGMMMMPGGIIGAPLMGGVWHLDGPVMSNMSTACEVLKLFIIKV